jgi:transcription elongation factor/antiterminator RfaH
MRNTSGDLHCSSFNSISLRRSGDASVAVASEEVSASRRQASLSHSVNKEFRTDSMKNKAVSVGVRWYAIHTKSRQEKRANSNLTAWRVDTFLPQLKRRSVRRGSTWDSKPLFPRYIFARFDPSQLLNKVNFTRGVQNVVSFGGYATPVDDGIIELIRAQIGEDGFVSLFEEFATGNKVKINFGPLKNLEGVFESGIKDTDRVRILLDTVSYQSHVVIEREMIEKIA